MTRRWNVSIWAGLLLVLAAPITYATVFVRFPSTRDLPWATFLILGAGLALTGVGVRRAYREPGVYRGKVAGPSGLGLGLALSAFFSYQMLFYVRQLPPSNGAPRAGQAAPDFTLPDQDGRRVTLSKLLQGGGEGGGGAVNGVLLIFYRGYW